MPCKKPKTAGSSVSLPIAYVTRTPVFKQESAVPTRAMTTEAARIIAKSVPLPLKRILPIYLAISPIGAGEVAAAANPAGPAGLALEKSPTTKLAAKYSIK